MNIKQLDDFIRNTGEITYQLWIDDHGSLYLQFKGRRNNGKFSKKLLFSVSQYAGMRNSDKSIGFPTGYHLNKKYWKVTGNKNDGGFLKDVLRHLLP